MRVNVKTMGLGGCLPDGGTIEFDGETVGDLMDHLGREMDSDISRRDDLVVFVNGDAVSAGRRALLSDGDELILVAPISGG